VSLPEKIDKRGRKMPPELVANAGKGRAKGSKNKISKNVKEAYEQCYEAIGGDEAFAAWARQSKNKTAFYQLHSKLLPKTTEHTGADGGPIEHTHDVTVAMDTDKLTQAIRKARGK